MNFLKKWLPVRGKKEIVQQSEEYNERISSGIDVTSTQDAEAALWEEEYLFQNEIYNIESEDPKDIKILHTTTKFQWISILVNILILSEYSLWRLLFLFWIFVDYISKTYRICFMQKQRVEFCTAIEIIADLLYFYNYVCLVSIHFWKRLHILVRKKRSMVALIFDGIIVIPYHTIYLLATNEHDISMIYAGLAFISFVRLYYLEEYFIEKTHDAGVEHWNYFVTRYVLHLFWCTHTIACVLYLLACPFGCVTHFGWASIVRDDVDTLTWYIYASYMAFINLSNTGYTQYLATYYWERIIISITMFVGFTLTTLILIGALCSDMVNKSYRLSNIRIQLIALQKHLKMIGMGSEEVKEIVNYYHLFWKRKKGVKEARAISLLPLPLQMEISFDINYYLLQCSLLFRNKPEPFLRTLSLNMKHEFFQPGEIIYKCNEIKYKMICVASGIIEVTSDEDYESPIISFGRGTVLGESALILTLPSKTTVAAAEYCELQVLYKADFIQIIKLYPEIYLELREAILTRINYFRKDEYKRESVSKATTLNLYVSQKKQFSAIKRVKKRLLRQTFIDVIPSNHHACGLYKYSVNVKKQKGRYIAIGSKFPWILSPSSSFLTVWEIVVLLDILAIAFTYPYLISYHREFPLVFAKVSDFLELFYYADLYIRLTTAIEGKDFMIKTFKEILAVHSKTMSFYIELIATFPLELFFFQSDAQLYYTVKINRVLKCFKIYTFFTKMEKEILTTSVLTLRLIKYVIYIVLIDYWFGILLFSSTCYSPVCIPDGWFRQHLESDQQKQLASPCSSYPVFMSIYYGLTVLSTIGFDDISPGNISDMVLMMFGILLGIFLFGYCTSELSATIIFNIRTKIDFQTAMFAVEKFMVHNKMDKSIEYRVIQFFELQWYYNQGVHFWKHSLLYNASTTIQKQVIIKERMETVAKSPLFQGTDENFIEIIATGAKIIVLPPDEIITYPGGRTRIMYIIQNGFCNRQTAKGINTTLGPGVLVGTRNILFGWPNLDRITTITHVRLLTITDTVFYSALSLFPYENAIIQKAIPKIDNSVLLSLKVLVLDFSLDMWTSKAFQKGRRKLNLGEKLKAAVNESFVYVPDNCEKHGEDYNLPFKELGFFYKVKYLLLPICILPQGIFLKSWVALRLSSSVLLALCIPYQQVRAPYSPTADKVVVILDIIGFIDIYILMFVGYYGKENQLIIHPLKTASHYINGAFVLDVILVFPWSLMIKSLSPDHNEGHSDFGHSITPHSLHCIVNLLKIFQAYRLARFFIYLEKNIKIPGLFVQLLKFIPFSILLLNVFSSLLMLSSCTYLHISDLKGNYTIGSIAAPEGYGKKSLQEYTTFCKKDSWIERSKFEKYHKSQGVYMLAFYWATNTFVLSGFGDLSAQDIYHLIVMVILVISSIFFFGYVFAYISSYTSDLHSVFSIYQGMVAEMGKYFQIESVSKYIKETCLNNAAYRWQRSEGMEPNKILSILHPALHEDAVLHLYESTLKCVSLFEGVERNFFRILGIALRERYFIKGSFIFREDDVIDTVFFVHRGKVEIKFYHNFYEEMFTRIGIGGILGNIGNSIKSRMLSSAMSITNMDILYIRTEEFYRMLNKYPDIKELVDAAFTKEENKDFCPPVSTLEDHSDSISDIEEELTDAESSSRRGTSTSIDSSSMVSSEQEKKESIVTANNDGPKFIKKELLILFLICMPKQWFKMIVLPDSKVLYSQVMVCVFAGYFNSILVTYIFAYQDFELWIIITIIVIDAVFLWDMFLELHTAYVNRYSDYVTDFKKIKKRYFAQRRQRILDAVSNLPYSYIAFLLPLIINVDAFLVFSILKLFSLLRLLKITNFFNSRWTNLLVNRLVLKLLSVFIWISLTIHLFSCVWYFIACPLIACFEESWARVFYETPRKVQRMYANSLYFILTVTTNTGIGDISPYREVEIIFLIVLMLLAKFLIGIFIGIATNVVSLHASFLTRYEGKIYELRDYLENENVSDHQMEKMWNYVKQLWGRRGGRQIPKLITDTMAYTNQCAIKYAVYGEELRGSYLFNKLQESFLRQLSNCINPVIFFPGNYIVQHGDSDQSMYFIHRGKVDVLTVHPNLTETIHDVLHSGEMFGLSQGLFHGIPHHFSFRARTTADIGVLILKDWTDIMLLFPRAKEVIYKRALAIYTIL